MTTHATVSIQLPDLPALTRSFELRTNRACHSVTLASEAWFLNNENTRTLLTEQERAVLPSAKISLLSALCFPTCDPPQLRFLTDFMTLLMFAHERLLKARSVHESGWSTEDVGGETGETGMDILGQHELFRSLIPELSKFSSRASPIWHARFTQSALAYRRAQLDSFHPLNMDDSESNILEHYMSHRRERTGGHILFDLAELALGHEPLEDTKIDNENVKNFGTARIVILHVLETLRDLAADIVALSSDIVCYNQFQSTHTQKSTVHLPLNAVAVCMQLKHLSAQGATNLIVKLLKGKIQSFLEIEAFLRNIHASGPSPETSKSAYSWILSSLSSLAGSMKGQKNSCESFDNPTINSLEALPRNDFSARLVDHLPAHVQVLRDYISGNVHWFYETELYFATKGEEVKAFGWIFLNSPTNANP